MKRISAPELALLLVRFGIVQESAIEDPEGYDRGATCHAIKLVAEAINAIISDMEES